MGLEHFQTAVGAAEKYNKRLTLDGILNKADELRPTVLAIPPIRSSATTFAREHRVPEGMKKYVEDVFVGTMCDTASLVAQNKPVDADKVVDATIKSSAGSLAQVVELFILREELTSKVREFAPQGQSGRRSLVHLGMLCPREGVPLTVPANVTDEQVRGRVTACSSGQIRPTEGRGSPR